MRPYAIALVPWTVTCLAGAVVLAVQHDDPGYISVGIALVVLGIAGAGWVAVFHWKAPLAWVIAALTWIGFASIMTLFALARGGGVERCRTLRSHNTVTADADWFPPRHLCVYTRGDGSTFIEGDSAFPLTILGFGAVFAALGTAGFVWAAFRVRPAS